MDAVQPNLTIKKDVNTGDRAGVRAAIDIAPGENLTHHPADRLPEREDRRLEPHRHLQHPGESLHDDAAKVTLGERELFTPKSTSPSPTSSCSPT